MKRKCGTLITLIISLAVVLGGCGNVGNTIGMIQTPMLSSGKEELSIPNVNFHLIEDEF